MRNLIFLEVKMLDKLLLCKLFVNTQSGYHKTNSRLRPYLYLAYYDIVPRDHELRELLNHAQSPLPGLSQNTTKTSKSPT